ncbi:MAG: hypothetical protein OQK70_11500 [Gammaproteobacteria bacterium]|nr:hypothetical protein [Gammaproteobacteria bacterium]
MTTVSNISDFTTELNEGFYSKKILIEGDSWVSHPFPNVTNIGDQIDRFKPDDYLLLNIAEPGDEAKEIFMSHGRQMKRLKRLLSTSQWGDTFDLIFLSAAGNDIVGPEIISHGYIKNKRDFPNLLGKELIADNFYNAMAGVVNGYSRFLKMRDTSSLNENTPVITHVYSYLTPREVGTHIGNIDFNKGWVKKHLKHQGIQDEDEQYEILVEMLDAFYRRVVKLEATFKNFMVVDTRKLLLKNGRPDLNLWFDEIHPNIRGFKKITKHIRKMAQQRDMWNL